MKRFLIFALIGPPVGAFAFIFITLPVIGILDHSDIEVTLAQLHRFIALIPLSYVVGIIPAMLTAFADRSARNLSAPLRILFVTVCGYFVGFLPFWWPFNAGGRSSDWAFGFIGATAGAICSWMAASLCQRTVKETYLPERK